MLTVARIALSPRVWRLYRSVVDLAMTGALLNDSSTKLIATYPDAEKFPLPRGIEIHFPAFFKIYQQAHQAELAGLSEVVGMAYRKALKNLVKNYLTQAYPSAAQEISAETLGKSIKRIEYPRIKALADMKDFILALCHLILAEKVGDAAADFLDIGRHKQETP